MKNPLLHIFLLATAGRRPPNNKNKSQEDTIIYEVCLSPGCVADGAQATLERMQALAPPHVVVQAGTCSSLCGNGPVVLQDNNQDVTKKKPTTHRKVKHDKILQLLYPPPQEQVVADPGPPPALPLNDVRRMHPPKPTITTIVKSEPPQALIQGYNLVLEADQAFEKKDYQTALQLYEKAVQVSFSTAIDLQRQREKQQSDSLSGLTWLIRARRRQAQSCLELGQYQDAVLAAQAACNLSRNTCAACFQVLARIYQAQENVVGELQAIQKMLALQQQHQDEMSVAEQNGQREWKFRLAKLERIETQKTE